MVPRNLPEVGRENMNKFPASGSFGLPSLREEVARSGHEQHVATSYASTGNVVCRHGRQINRKLFSQKTTTYVWIVWRCEITKSILPPARLVCLLPSSSAIPAMSKRNDETLMHGGCLLLGFPLLEVHLFSSARLRGLVIGQFSEFVKISLPQLKRS